MHRTLRTVAHLTPAHSYPKLRHLPRKWRPVRYRAFTCSTALRDGLFMGTVTTDDPTHTNFEQLLDKIDPTCRAGGKGDNEKTTVTPHVTPAELVLLLSPAYAQLALQSDTPLKLFSRLKGQDDFVNKSLRSYCAVVDKLPALGGPETGLEGLSYFYVRDAASTKGATSPLDHAAQKPGSVHFAISQAPGEGTSISLQLPLAHTVFTNGYTSTLRHVTYRFDADGKNAFESITAELLEVARISLPTLNARALRTQLEPLTPFRPVTNAMGNIIRTLSSLPTFDGSTKMPQLQASATDQPASQELEDAVAKYFKALNIAPEPLNVWALISPQRTQEEPRSYLEYTNSQAARHLKRITIDNLVEQWANLDNPPIIGTLVNNVLASGGRLCKVLSGGGGWGKKAGLLSLDPDTQYTTRNLRDDQGWDFNFGEESGMSPDEQKKEAMGEIVKTGEHIMFFTTHRRPDMFLTEDRMQGVSHAVAFGPIPSTIDTVPASQPTADDKTPVIKHHEGLFGALSEGGFALSVASERTSNKAPVKSKFDVPLSLLFALQKQGTAAVPSTDAKKSRVPIVKSNSRKGDSQGEQSAKDKTGMKLAQSRIPRKIFSSEARTSESTSSLLPDSVKQPVEHLESVPRPVVSQRKDTASHPRSDGQYRLKYLEFMAMKAELKAAEAHLSREERRALFRERKNAKELAKGAANDVANGAANGGSSGGSNGAAFVAMKAAEAHLSRAERRALFLKRKSDKKLAKGAANSAGKGAANDAATGAAIGAANITTEAAERVQPLAANSPTTDAANVTTEGAEGVHPAAAGDAANNEERIQQPHASNPIEPAPPKIRPLKFIASNPIELASPKVRIRKYQVKDNPDFGETQSDVAARRKPYDMMQQTLQQLSPPSSQTSSPSPNTSSGQNSKRPGAFDGKEARLIHFVEAQSNQMRKWVESKQSVKEAQIRQLKEQIARMSKQMNDALKSGAFLSEESSEGQAPRSRHGSRPVRVNEPSYLSDIMSAMRTLRESAEALGTKGGNDGDKKK